MWPFLTITSSGAMDGTSSSFSSLSSSASNHQPTNMSKSSGSPSSVNSIFRDCLSYFAKSPILLSMIRSFFICFSVSQSTTIHGTSCSSSFFAARWRPCHAMMILFLSTNIGLAKPISEILLQIISICFSSCTLLLNSYCIRSFGDLYTIWCAFLVSTIDIFSQDKFLHSKGIVCRCKMSLVFI